MACFGGCAARQACLPPSPLPLLARPVLPALQEVEKQYKEGTLKHAITRVLIAVRPEALTAQGEPATLPAGWPSCGAVPARLCVVGT